MVDLRAYVFLDSLQPQFASFQATISKGYLPKVGQASLFVEIAPGMAINQILDVALKSTDVTAGMQIVERHYGMLELHSESQADVRQAGQAILDCAGSAGKGPAQTAGRCQPGGAPPRRHADDADQPLPPRQHDPCGPDACSCWRSNLRRTRRWRRTRPRRPRISTSSKSVPSAVSDASTSAAKNAMLWSRTRQRRRRLRKSPAR